MKVLHRFADLEDNHRIYDVGDEYPRKGLSPTKERISELSSTNNKIGKPLIEAPQEKRKKK